MPGTFDVVDEKMCAIVLEVVADYTTDDLLGADALCEDVLRVYTDAMGKAVSKLGCCFSSDGLYYLAGCILDRFPSLPAFDLVDMVEILSRAMGTNEEKRRQATFECFMAIADREAGDGPIDKQEEEEEEEEDEEEEEEDEEEEEEDGDGDLTMMSAIEVDGDDTTTSTELPENRCPAVDRITHAFGSRSLLRC